MLSYAYVTHQEQNQDKVNIVIFGRSAEPNGLYASIIVGEDPSKPEMEVSCVQARGSTIEWGNDEYIYLQVLSYRVIDDVGEKVSSWFVSEKKHISWDHSIRKEARPS